MKIIGFKVENVRLLKAFAMKFKDKGLTQIRGKNKQGKSTAWDCLELLLRGNKMQTKDMITHGKDKAEIVGQIDNYLIRRVLKKEGANSLEVRDVDSNMRMDTKPQDFLTSLINDLTFNPLPWLGKSSDEKLRFIQNLTGLDLTKVDADIKKAETGRYDAGVVLRGMGSKPGPLEKVKYVNVGELLIALDAEKSKKHDIELAQAGILQLTTTKLQADEKVLKLEADLKLANTARDQAIADLSNETAKAKKLPRPNIEEAQKVFDGAEEINDKHKAYTDRVEDIRKWTNADSDHKSHEVGVTAARDKKDNLLRSAKMPIKGMEIRDDGLYFDGTHCENWSDSEGYGIALDLCVAMLKEKSPDKKLEAVFVNRGELYDSDHLAELDKWGNKHNIQIGIAIVDNDVKKSADGVFYIVAGEVQ